MPQLHYGDVFTCAFVASQSSTFLLFRPNRSGQSSLDQTKATASFLRSTGSCICRSEQVPFLPTVLCPRHSGATLPSTHLLFASLRGRFSAITLCRDVETSQVFAAKITSYQADQRQLVLREYQLLRRLHHPHLVQLHNAFITPCYMVLVEELCPGKELLHSLAAR